jgi:hypothetical protein
MTTRQRLAQGAAYAALCTRGAADIPLSDPLCAFDLADKRGIEVRIVEVPSLEAMYVKQKPPLILVSSLRWAGRRSYNCAHEIGHDYFGHGTRVDEYLGERHKRKVFNAEEFLADCFAGYLLMPKVTVCHGFAKRGWSPATCTADQVFVVAGWLGVGYTTLIHHMHLALNLIDQSHADNLLKTSRKDLLGAICGDMDCSELVIVDSQWHGRPVDIEVGDAILAPRGADVEGEQVEVVRETVRGRLLRGRTPGIGRVTCQDGFAVFVRVSRKGFTGRSVFRHIEESGDE